MQIPRAVAGGILRKRAGHVGLGLNVWPNVHVDDSEFHVCSALGANQTHLHDDDRQLQISILFFTTPSWKERRRVMVAKGSTLARTGTTRSRMSPPRLEEHFMIRA